MEAPSRKSNRKRQPNKKYSIDAFEGLDIIDGGAENELYTDLIGHHDDDQDDDFQIDLNASPEPPDDDLSVDGAVEEEDDDDEEDNQELDFDDGQSIIGGSEAEGPAFRDGRRTKVELGKMKSDPRYNPRGLLEPVARGSKELQRLFFFGPAKEDQTPAIKSHFKWSIESTIPSHRPNAGGMGGFKRSYFHNDQAIKAEAEEGWDWYEVEGGKDAFNHRQQSRPLNSIDARPYISPTASGSCKLLMGPYKKQRLFEIGMHSSLNLNDAWLPGPSSADIPPPTQDTKSRRNGYLLNLGEKIKHLDWVPNLEGPRQFLAITTSPLIGSTPEEQQFSAPFAPAFTPQPPLKSSIQIWEFQSSSEGQIDTSSAPKLRKVICTEWGEVKLFKWCPMPRKFPSTRPTERVSLGLLAGVWGDGVLRVLDIFVSSTSDADTEYELIKSVAFAAHAPNSVCTCVAWLSSTSVVAGCANGCVGIWNLPSALQDGVSTMADGSAHNAEPVIFCAIASTYILSVTTCYPSRPYLLLTSSMSGYIQLTDLMELNSKATMSPTATVRANRSRIGRSALVWHDFAQVVLSVDDNYTLIAYPIRRFFRQISFTRYLSSASCLAVSPVHPFVMAGCLGGETISNNPLRRAYENKVPIWNQIWFTHEWRRPRPEDSSTNGDVEMEDATTHTYEDGRAAINTQSGLASQGLSRVLEGFKCREIKLFNAEDAFTHRENGAVYSTIYELKSSISSVCWNPNIHVGGWIAAGTANGLLRIEDIAS